MFPGGPVARRNKDRVYFVLSFLQEKLSGALSGSGQGASMNQRLWGPSPPQPPRMPWAPGLRPRVCAGRVGGGVISL